MAANIFSGTAGAGFLASLPHLERIRNETPWRRPEGNNLDVPDDENDNGAIDSEGAPIQGLCHMVTILPEKAYNNSGLEPLAIALAAQHLNTGNGTILPQLQGLTQRCGIRFSVEFLESSSSSSVDPAASALQTVASVVARRRDGVERLPCAFIGSSDSSETIATSTLTGLQGYPQISGSSTAAELDDPGLHPLFARTVPSDRGSAVVFARFFYGILGIERLVVLRISRGGGQPDGRGFGRALELAAAAVSDGELSVVSVDLALSDPDHFPDVLGVLQNSQYNHFFAVLDHDIDQNDLNLLMEEAHRLGIAGTGEHQWFFGGLDNDSGLATLISDQEFEPGSALHAAYKGTGVLVLSDDQDGGLLESIRELNNTADLEYMSSALPGGNRAVETIVPGVFDLPGPFTRYYYEAAAAIGLAACGVDYDDGIQLTGAQHYDSIVLSGIPGPDGPLPYWRPEEDGLQTDRSRLGLTDQSDYRSRDPRSAVYTVLNYSTETEEQPGVARVVRFLPTTTHKFQEGSWFELRPNVFNGVQSGTFSAASAFREANFVALGAQIFAYALLAIILGMTLKFMLWVNRHKKTKVVLASQPIFLYSICAGVVILSFAIIPLSIDLEESNVDWATIACTSTLWFTTMGSSIMISMLVAKYHRIYFSSVYQSGLERIKMTRIDVAKILLALQGANVLLLSLMSVFAPVRYETNTEFFQQDGGRCAYSEAAPYLSVIGAINVGILFYGVFIAFRLRNISTEYGESTSISLSLKTILSMILIGGPFTVIAQDNSTAFVIVGSISVFLCCACLLIFIFFPLIISNKAVRAEELVGDDVVYIDGDNDLENMEQYIGCRIVSTKARDDLIKENEELKILLRNNAVARGVSNDTSPYTSVESTFMMSLSSILDPINEESSIDSRSTKSDDASDTSKDVPEPATVSSDEPTVSSEDPSELSDGESPAALAFPSGDEVAEEKQDTVPNEKSSEQIEREKTMESVQGNVDKSRESNMLPMKVSADTGVSNNNTEVRETECSTKDGDTTRTKESKKEKSQDLPGENSDTRLLRAQSAPELGKQKEFFHRMSQEDKLRTLRRRRAEAEKKVKELKMTPVEPGDMNFQLSSPDDTFGSC